MKDINMTTMTKDFTRLSRRAFLGAMAAGAGLMSLPISLRAAPAAAGSAIAFDGDALILARDTLSRRDGGEGWMELSLPAAGGILSRRIRVGPAGSRRVSRAGASPSPKMADTGGRREARACPVPR